MKVGITCRQPFLGADEWIEEEIKKAKAPAALKDSRSSSKDYCSRKG